MLLSGNAYTKDIYSTYVAENGLADRSIVFDDDNKTIIVNGQKVESTESNYRIIKWKGNFELASSVDRTTAMSVDHKRYKTQGTKF